ncbi:hypothetical protein [Chitinophaga varians]|uniref:hypothetical protein n=1 Tax=Chitinophaga varians TaxID=2202339 RepID=UPI00165F07F5|nr:hypothetical protein [Chitinophaga varians]MBC9913300.1 hypothetical protein [Chitinophaga varians]
MIKVTALSLAGEDDRGSNYLWDCTRNGELMLCYRHAGSSSGQHYHEGKQAYKDPEILIFCSGKALLHWCHKDGDRIETTEITAPAQVEIPANYWHQLIAVTDCCYLELNSMADVQKDSVRVWRTDLEKMFIEK